MNSAPPPGQACTGRWGLAGQGPHCPPHLAILRVFQVPERDFLLVPFLSTCREWGCNIQLILGWVTFFSSVRWIHASVITHVTKSVRQTLSEWGALISSVRFCLIYGPSLEPRTGTTTLSLADRWHISWVGTGCPEIEPLCPQIQQLLFWSQISSKDLPLPEDDGQILSEDDAQLHWGRKPSWGTECICPKTWQDLTWPFGSHSLFASLWGRDQLSYFSREADRGPWDQHIHTNI